MERVSRSGGRAWGNRGVLLGEREQLRQRDKSVAKAMAKTVA